MKKIFEIKKILTCTAFIFMLACDTEPDRILYKGTDFVFFDANATMPILENSTTSLKIPVKVSTAQDESITITYEITAEGAVEDIDFEIISPNPLTIPAGEFETFIEIEAIDNAIVESESKTLEIVITDISSSSLEKQVRTSLSVPIVNDDCLPEIPKIVKWVGSITVEDAGVASFPATGLPGPFGSCGGVLIINNADIVQVGLDSEIAIKFIQDSEGSTTGIAKVSRARIFKDDDFAGYQYEGEGIYDEDAGEIIIEYTLYDEDGAVVFTGATIITNS